MLHYVRTDSTGRRVRLLERRVKVIQASAEYAQLSDAQRGVVDGLPSYEQAAAILAYLDIRQTSLVR